MPVIGRLDDQVEAILINPLKGRRTDDAVGRRADDAKESAPGAEESARTATPTPATREQDDADSAARKREADDVAWRRERDDGAALPVWLL
ncbi:MAG TPA: hypothetical protein VEY11_02610 [Pyrinomonadaceae bacterium]|nr:hypothetical protein [Pyrinomonadaceae bacterium]